MVYRFGKWLLDTGRCELVRDGQTVHVEPKVWKLIVYLVEHRDRAVSRNELLNKVWSGEYVSDNALSVCVRMARQILGDDVQRQAHIRTVRGVGYRFVAEVDARSIAEVRVGNHVDLALQDKPVDLEAIDRQLMTRPSVVVLPFTLIGNTKRSSVFAQGLTQDITTQIARTRSLFVIARGTAFQFEGRNIDVREVGQKLGVRYLVHGAIQTQARKLRVTATLANTSTREEIWSETYQRSIDDFAEVQSELAELIVGTLQTEVERAEQLRSLLMSSANLDAWSAYHRGCWHMYKFRGDDMDRAEFYFRRSIEMEPTVPRPYAGLSFVCFERVFLDIDDKPEEGICRAFDLALQALSIDPHDPMAHWALSRAYLLQGELESSKQSLETAIQLNPSYAIAQYSLGWVGLQLGENELCKSRIDVAKKLSPYDPLKFAMLGVYALNLAMMGRTAEAVEIAVQSVAQPNAHHQALAFAAVSHALDGQLRHGSEYLRRVRAVASDYRARDFFNVYKFKKQADIARIERAFRDMDAFCST